MALHTKTVLVCDACQTEQETDQVIEVLGVQIGTGSFHDEMGGGGLYEVYFCFDCATHKSLMDVARQVPEHVPTPKKQRRAKKAENTGG